MASHLGLLFLSGRPSCHQILRSHGIRVESFPVQPGRHSISNDEYFDIKSYSLRRRNLKGIPIINLRRSDDRLRFIMVIPLLIRRSLLSEQKPWLLNTMTAFYDTTSVHFGGLCRAQNGKDIRWQQLQPCRSIYASAIMHKAVIHLRLFAINRHHRAAWCQYIHWHRWCFVRTTYNTMDVLMDNLTTAIKSLHMSRDLFPYLP